ncbi:MAG: hypothetical protein ACQEQ4_05515 [Fibrobacterota bacterium]
MNKKANHTIMAIHIQDRKSKVQDVQEVLTQKGSLIKTRLGLHETQEDFEEPGGLIILELLDKKDEIADLSRRLAAIEGIDVGDIVFSH